MTQEKILEINQMINEELEKITYGELSEMVDDLFAEDIVYYNPEIDDNILLLTDVVEDGPIKEHNFHLDYFCSCGYHLSINPVYIDLNYISTQCRHCGNMMYMNKG